MRASEGGGGWGVGGIPTPQESFANLGSLKCHFLHFDIISEVESNFHSKKILKCSDMIVCKTQILKLHAGWMSGQEIEE